MLKFIVRDIHERNGRERLFFGLPGGKTTRERHNFKISVDRDSGEKFQLTPKGTNHCKSANLPIFMNSSVIYICYKR